MADTKSQLHSWQYIKTKHLTKRECRQCGAFSLRLAAGWTRNSELCTKSDKIADTDGDK